MSRYSTKEKGSFNKDGIKIEKVSVNDSKSLKSNLMELFKKTLRKIKKKIINIYLKFIINMHFLSRFFKKLFPFDLTFTTYIGN